MLKELITNLAGSSDGLKGLLPMATCSRPSDVTNARKFQRSLAFLYAHGQPSLLNGFLSEDTSKLRSNYQGRNTTPVQVFLLAVS